METAKAKARREREGFFSKYLVGKGIDIGAGNDKVVDDADTYDLFQSADFRGDATFMEGVQDGKYDWVYSSHCLEHVDDPETALQNWWRILKPGGNLILFVPHRDLYEKRLTLPSRWNLEHKSFWVIERTELPHTRGLLETIKGCLSDYEILLVRKCDEGNDNQHLPEEHARGEFSIEVVIKKLK